jgi:hypothetical protein
MSIGFTHPTPCFTHSNLPSWKHNVPPSYKGAILFMQELFFFKTNFKCMHGRGGGMVIYVYGV